MTWALGDRDIALLFNTKAFPNTQNLDLPDIIEQAYPKLLQDVARLLHAMPVIQVSVESDRLFSALKLFKTNHRNKLKEDILDALLFLRANK